MKVITIIVLLVLLGASSPFIYYASIGWYHGYDVSHAFKTFFAGAPTGKTIDPSKVPVDRLNVTWAGDIENHKLSEASGLAQSTFDPEIFYSINDGGHEPQIFALDKHGNDLGFWSVEVDENVDWEDIATFQYQGEAYLLIADTGDNFAWRRYVEMIVVRQPNPDQLAMATEIPVEWRFKVEYPNGYRDSEAVAVDEASQTILFVSKRVIPAEVYRVPLKPAKDTVKAVRMALLNSIPQPGEQDLWEDPKYGATMSRPTGMDIKQNLVVILTYKDAYLYTKGWRDNWIDVFAKIPQRIPLPKVAQQESVALTKDKKYLYVTTEREGGTGRAGIYQAALH